MLKICFPVPKESVVRPKEDHQKETRRTGAIPKPLNDQERNVFRMGTIPKREDEDVTSLDLYLMPPPPPPPPTRPPPPPLPHIPIERVIVEPIVPAERSTIKHSPRNENPVIHSKSFSVAELQQYTNSFSSDNLLGAGMLGNVYRAQLPDGKVRQ